MKKLTEKQKEEIRGLQGKQSTYEVADQYGVSNVAIWNIWNPKDKSQENNSLDTVLIKKMIPAFIKAKIKLNLEPAEIKRIKELFKENQ